MPQAKDFKSQKETLTGKISEFKKFCLEHYPTKDKSHLLDDINDFSSATETLFDQFEKFREKIANLPLLAALVFWIESMSKEKWAYEKYATVMMDLISQGFIILKDKKGALWTLKHMIEHGHEAVIEDLRCNEVWHTDKTEEYVGRYIDFANWLSEKTLGFIPPAVDPDKAKTVTRRLSFEDYIALIKSLDDRESTIAQLMYFGGARTLEEMMDLRVEDIHEDHVLFQGAKVFYPKHVMKFLHAFLNGRKKGYVFTGKITADKLDGTLPYRALKTVISKLGFDPAFTFKDFVKQL